MKARGCEPCTQGAARPSIYGAPKNYAYLTKVTDRLTVAPTHPPSLCSPKGVRATGGFLLSAFPASLEEVKSLRAECSDGRKGYVRRCGSGMLDEAPQSKQEVGGLAEPLRICACLSQRAAPTSHGHERR